MVKIPLQVLAGHHRLASEAPFKWRFSGVTADDGPTLNTGLVAL